MCTLHLDQVPQLPPNPMLLHAYTSCLACESRGDVFTGRGVSWRGQAGQDLCCVCLKWLRTCAAIRSAGLQIADFDYKEQIHSKAWFACHCLCFISSLYPGQPDGVIQCSHISGVCTSGLAFRFFRLPLIRVNTYLHGISQRKKGSTLV